MVVNAPPIVTCNCTSGLDHGADPFCDACRGAGVIVCRCDCGAHAELTTVDGRIRSCVECFIRWEALAEPLSELLATESVPTSEAA